MKRSLAAVAAVVVLMLSGCSAWNDHEDKRGRGDAPVARQGPHGGDDSPAFCTNMPNGFGNVCGKCIAHFHPWAFVVTTSTSYAPSQLAVFQAPKQCGGSVVAGGAPAVSAEAQGFPEDDD
jgi:hypothetical protein